MHALFLIALKYKATLFGYAMDSSKSVCYFEVCASNYCNNCLSCTRWGKREQPTSNIHYLLQITKWTQCLKQHDKNTFPNKGHPYSQQLHKQRTEAAWKAVFLIIHACVHTRCAIVTEPFRFCGVVACFLQSVGDNVTLELALAIGKKKNIYIFSVGNDKVDLILLNWYQSKN